MDFSKSTEEDLLHAVENEMLSPEEKSAASAELSKRRASAMPSTEGAAQTDDGFIQRIMKGRKPSEQEKKSVEDVFGKESSGDVAAFLGAAQGYTGGFMDEAAGALGAGILSLTDPEGLSVPEDAFRQGPVSFGDRYRSARNDARKLEQIVGDEHPILHGVGGLVGAVKSPLNQLIPGSGGGASTLGQRLGAGAGLGALYGLGGAEDLSEKPVEAAIQTGMSGLLGLGGQGVGEGFGALGRWLSSASERVPQNILKSIGADTEALRKVKQGVSDAEAKELGEIFKDIGEKRDVANKEYYETIGNIENTLGKIGEEAKAGGGARDTAIDAEALVRQTKLANRDAQAAALRDQEKQLGTPVITAIQRAFSGESLVDSLVDAAKGALGGSVYSSAKKALQDSAASEGKAVSPDLATSLKTGALTFLLSTISKTAKESSKISKYLDSIRNQLSPEARAAFDARVDFESKISAGKALNRIIQSQYGEKAKLAEELGSSMQNLQKPYVTGREGIFQDILGNLGSKKQTYAERAAAAEQGRRFLDVDPFAEATESAAKDAEDMGLFNEAAKIRGRKYQPEFLRGKDIKVINAKPKQELISGGPSPVFTPKNVSYPKIDELLSKAGVTPEAVEQLSTPVVQGEGKDLFGSLPFSEQYFANMNAEARDAFLKGQNPLGTNVQTNLRRFPATASPEDVTNEGAKEWGGKLGELLSQARQGPTNLAKSPQGYRFPGNTVSESNEALARRLRDIMGPSQSPQSVPGEVDALKAAMEITRGAKEEPLFAAPSLGGGLLGLGGGATPGLLRGSPLEAAIGAILGGGASTAGPALKRVGQMSSAMQVRNAPQIQGAGRALLGSPFTQPAAASGEGFSLLQQLLQPRTTPISKKDIEQEQDAASQYFQSPK